MPKSDNGRSRLDRIEAIIEAVATRQADIEGEFGRLLRAQVVVVDTMRELAAEQVKLAAEHVNLAERQRNTEDNLNVLITVAGDTQDKLNALIAAAGGTEEKLNALIMAAGGTEEKLNALISIVDDIVRRTPRRQ
ncbi:MAG: hypothetical protein NT090_27320 [Acidobacteria bacterium]|jgi:tartrate dehydratase alpha subunit/fumarate hydratase class I-like protein|nr:hypothetical protein [Acidobacteriota bacterium]